jgi:hypothetical protein
MNVARLPRASAKTDKKAALGAQASRSERVRGYVTGALKPGEVGTTTLKQTVKLRVDPYLSSALAYAVHVPGLLTALPLMTGCGSQS